MTKKELRDTRRDAGLCIDCNTPSTALRCPEHTTRNKKQLASFYTRKKERRECIIPGCKKRVLDKAVRCVVHTQERKDAYAKKVAQGVCTKCPSAATCGNKCNKHAIMQQALNWRRKQMIMDHYGGPTCVGCNETELAVLQLDHKDGGGNKHRRKIGNGDLRKGSVNTYQWIIENNYPPLFRVLCANCNVRARCRLQFPRERGKLKDE
jgi:hypothetical protein